MKHIAVLSTMYYPDMGAPSAVVDKFIQPLKANNKITIITKTYNNQNTFVHRENVRYITGIQHRILIFCDTNIKKCRLVFLSKLILFAINIYKLIATQFMNPTANAWENDAYYKQLEDLHNDESIDYIISVSNTFFTQFAAKKFSDKYPDVKWVAFITDPFAENYIYYKYKVLKKWWRHHNMCSERNFYMSAYHTVLSIEMYNYAKDVLCIPEYRISPFHFALNDRYANLKDFMQNHDNEVRLIYAGAVYNDIRNPRYMLATISSLHELKLDLYINTGECEDILKHYVKDNITRQGYVTKEKYDRLICCEYDILVNIGNISTLQAPSKMVDLLSTGKPILNFYFVEDAQYEMIERYPLGLNVRDGEENAIEKVSNFCLSMKGKRMSYNEVESIFPENSPRTQIELLNKIFDA